MFWERKQQAVSVESCGHALYEALTTALRQNGRIHVEDLISASAAIVGESCIGATGDFDPLDNKFVPGQRIFSTNANVIICGDVSEFVDSPADSIFGILSDKLLSCGFNKSDFPPLGSVFSHFAANIGNKEDWGKVPLSIIANHHPFMMPLRAAYEMRPTVEKLFAPLGDNRQQKLHAATLTLAETLCQTRDVLARRIAISLALETVNGMAKTVPLTDKGMENVKANQKK